MKKKPLKSQKRKQPNQASPSAYLKGLFHKFFRVDEKRITVVTTKAKTYKIQVMVSDLPRPTLPVMLKRMCKKNKLRLLNFKTASATTTADAKPKSVINFECRSVRVFKSNSRKKIQSFYEDHSMPKTELLAHSLNRGLMFHAASQEMHEMIVALSDGESGGQGLRVLRHGEGARLANQIFQEYVSDRDYTNFLGFLQWLDDGLYKFRGNQALNLEDLMNEDDDDEPRRGRGKKGKKSFAVKNTRQMQKSPTPDEGDTDEPSQPDNSVVISADKTNREFNEETIKNHIRNRARQNAKRYLNP